MVDGRFDEVAGDVAFVVAAMIGRPALRPLFAISEHVGRLQIAIWLCAARMMGIQRSSVARICSWAVMISGSPCGSTISAMHIDSTVWCTQALENTYPLCLPCGSPRLAFAASMKLSMPPSPRWARCLCVRTWRCNGGSNRR